MATGPHVIDSGGPTCHSLKWPSLSLGNVELILESGKIEDISILYPRLAERSVLHSQRDISAAVHL